MCLKLLYFGIPFLRIVRANSDGEMTKNQLCSWWTISFQIIDNPKNLFEFLLFWNSIFLNCLTEALFIRLIIRLFQLVFSARTVFFSLTTNQPIMFFSRLISTAERGPNSNGAITKTKVVNLDEIYKFVLVNVFIWKHLRS
jgi:hypothetical protein